MTECYQCGKMILSDKPVKCPFCGKVFEKRNVCPTCSAGFTGLNGYGDSSLYQDIIAGKYSS